MVVRARGFIRGVSGPLGENPALVALYVTTLITMLGQGLISPVLPLFANAFGIGAAAVGFAVGAFGLARLVTNLPAGILGQRTGRKPLLVAGPVIMGLATAACALSPNYPVFLLFRFLGGVGSSIYMTSTMVYLTEVSTPQNRGRLMSLQQGSLLVGTTLGPVVGGVLANSFGMEAPFYVVGAVGCVSGLWCLLQVREPAARPRPARDAAAAPSPKGEGSLLRLFLSPSFAAVGLFSMTVFLTRSGSRQSVAPLRGAEVLHLDPGQLGFIFGAGAVATLVATLTSGSLADRFGRKAVIVPGAMVAAAGLLLTSVSGSFWAYLLGEVVEGAGMGIAGPAPAAFAADMAPPGKASVTMGLFRTVSDVGFVLGPVLLGWIADLYSFNLSLQVNAGIIAGSAIVLAVVARETVARRGQGRREQAPAAR